MSLNNSINAQIFYALEVSEESKVPMLIMSAPGMGKSTTVAWFAEHNGYELETLRGNSTSEDEIMGYDVVDEKNPNAESARHLIPDWFNRVKENAKAGKKTLLFVDELTTCTDQVQSALLHLIFERKVHADNLPSDTLIVAAGNYSQSLGNSFGLIPPLMNRFCIFNLIPTNDDIVPFLSKYSKGKNSVNISKMLKDMRKNKKVVSDEVRARIGEYIEDCVLQTTKILGSKNEKKLDIKVTDTQSIYSDLENDEALMGFVTPRTLCYYRDATIAAYMCFGKDGIVNGNYKRIIEGLVGLGLTRKGGNSGEIDKHVLTERYYDSMKAVIADLEKLENDKVAEYEKYFTEMVVNKADKDITYEEIILINNKITELKNDSKISTIDRPIDTSVVERLCKLYASRADVLKDLKIDAQSLMGNSKTVGCTATEIADCITRWNSIADSLENLGTLITDSSRGYSDDVKNIINSQKKQVGSALPKLRILKRNLAANSPAEAGLLPEFHDKYLKN